jgi:hypothetical protein
VSDHAALIQDVDPVADLRDEVEVVVDDEDAAIDRIGGPADVVDHRGGLGLVHAGGRLVQEQERRRQGRGARQLESASGPRVELASRPLARIPQPSRDEQGSCVLPAFGVAMTLRHHRGDVHVLAERERGEQPEVLERPRHPRPGDRCVARPDVAIVQQDGPPVAATTP